MSLTTRIAIACILCLVGSVTTFSSNYHFQNILIEHGLSNLNINALCQDHRGYIWIATQRGLNRYNGYEFQQYFFNRGDSLGLPSNLITTLHCDDNDNLFVGTNIGLSCYNLKRQKFIHSFPELQNIFIRDIEKWNGNIYVATDSGLYKISETGKVHLLSAQSRFNVLFVDRKNRLWCGGYNSLLYVDENQIISQISYDNLFREGANEVFSIAEGRQQDDLWLGTNDGVFCLKTNRIKSGKKIKYEILSENLRQLRIKFIIERNTGIFWIGTYKSGLYEYNASTRQIRFLNDDNNGFGLESENFSSVLIDNIGNTWLGTFDNGLAVNFKYLKHFNPDASLNHLTEGKFVTSITPFGADRLLISTRGKGFFVYQPKTGESKHFSSKNSGLNSNFIKNTYLDNNNQIWIGSLSGVQVYDLTTQTFFSLPSINIGYSSIFCDKEWVYLGIPGHGLMIFDKRRKLVFKSTDFGNFITKIVAVNKNKLLLTSYGGGIFVYDKNTKTATAIHDEFPEAKGLSRIVTAYIDQSDILWLGSYLWGMYKVDLQNQIIVNYDKTCGLPSNDVIGIVEDQYNQLWLSTSYGLARFDKSTQTIKKYFINEGVNNTQFHEKSAFRNNDGMIFFGGNYGITCFSPEQLVIPNVAAPQLILEELQVLNKTVVPSPESRILKEAISYASKITLSHREKEFSLKLTAFDFLSPEQVQYAYRMEGLDDNWVETGTRRLVSFAYLNPGSYSFQFKARSTDGDWSSPSKPLTIEVRPAPWFSWWALSLYTIFMVILAWSVFRFLFRLKLYRHKLELEQREHVRENEVHEMKLRFFTNISHEFRTPLTILAGLSKQLLNNDRNENQKGQVIKSLHMNIDRLLKLVNQILVFRELENDTLQLVLKKRDIADVVVKAVKPFEYYATKKDISIDFSKVKNFELPLDEDKVDKVLCNLLSNAIKFTPGGGNVKISLEILNAKQVQNAYKEDTPPELDTFIQISVADSGPGVPPANLKTIFRRYKKFGSRLVDYSGTGIGLDFCQRLISRHGGFIKAENGDERGAVFSFVLPVKPINQEGKIRDAVLADWEWSVKNQPTKKIQKRKNKTVLVVEDDPELNQMITESLMIYYSVLSSFDGNEAIELVENKPIDLIVSDVMMPNVDGLEFCKRIKSSDKWGHIPFILLSAKTDIDMQISGLSIGADVYVTKPFEINYLVALVDSQLNNREKIHQIFMNGAMPKFEKEELNQRDISFLKKVNGLIEENYRNTEFNVADLSQLMNMSRSTFYRKFIGLTNVTPSDYIKKFKVNKAVEILKTQNYSIAEASELAGFATQGYFSTTFKNEVGMTPSEYIKKNT